ncbi:deoxyribonuclease IV [Ammonifex thiophilus]|uniref:Probable endonuclease 4 n=1 Tax=Ammonifex thiophilus TaxID=444093 RepID=A0A3D8P3E8_9THEO|nr:deoxyribonuclease IV [Ammonifex thiophilus]RDV83241.1 deoxyribonuclease IV [Ammonifex thiophilus]
MPRLGAHMSIAGGVDKAVWRGHSIGCETIQIFTKNTNQWYARPLSEAEVERFRQAQEETGVRPVFAHTSYLINLGSPREELWRKSIESFVGEIERCHLLGLPFIVVHPGAHMGEGEAEGLKRIARGLDEVLERTAHTQVKILLETTAGQGSQLGYRFEHLAWLIGESRHPQRLGVCFDTCHAFAAGYDLRTPEAFAATWEEFERVIGLNRLEAVHLNDSRGTLGSRLDRHEHIGKGEIGLEAFRLLLNDPRFQRLPMVLETPKGPDLKEDVMNLNTLRSLIR